MSTPQERKLEKSKKRGAIYEIDIFLNTKTGRKQTLHHMGLIDGKRTAAWIPTYLHKSVKHNLRTGYGMELINEITMRWIEKQRTAGLNNSAASSTVEKSDEKPKSL